jgi:hypothetical protein
VIASRRRAFRAENVHRRLSQSLSTRCGRLSTRPKLDPESIEHTFLHRLGSLDQSVSKKTVRRRSKKPRSRIEPNETADASKGAANSPKWAAA